MQEFGRPQPVHRSAKARLEEFFLLGGLFLFVWSVLFWLFGLLGNFLWWDLEGDEVNIGRNFSPICFQQQTRNEFSRSLAAPTFYCFPSGVESMDFVMWALGFVDCCFFYSLDKSFGMALQIVSCFGVSSATYIDN